MKIAATFARGGDGMVVATLNIQRTDNDPSQLLINMDGEKVMFTTESKTHQFRKNFTPNDTSGADKWAREVVGSIKQQVEVHRIELPRKKEAGVKAYCMKCRTQREIKDPKPIVMKNKRPATQGLCPVCGTKLFRIGKS